MCCINLRDVQRQDAKFKITDLQYTLPYKIFSYSALPFIPSLSLYSFLVTLSSFLPFLSFTPLYHQFFLCETGTQTKIS